jgi:L-threonylcarbamoyladenylate synthase
VVAPTDTVYGLAADPAVPGAEARLRAAKGRPARKPFPLLAASRKQVEASGAKLGPAEQALARRFWPGPLTLVLRTGRRSEGFRVPAHPVMLALLRALGRPLRVTSANRSGRPAPRTLTEALADLAGSVDLGLEDGPAPLGVPSTVARIERGRQVRVLRPGALVLADLNAALARPTERKRTSRG